MVAVVACGDIENANERQSFPLTWGRYTPRVAIVMCIGKDGAEGNGRIMVEQRSHVTGAGVHTLLDEMAFAKLLARQFLQGPLVGITYYVSYYMCMIK